VWNRTLQGSHERQGSASGNTSSVPELSDFADDVWRDGRSAVDPRNSFMSGLPAQDAQKKIKRGVTARRSGMNRS